MNPPENYREAEGKRNCGNCKYCILHRNDFTITWYKCGRPGEIINDQGNLVKYTNMNFVCDGHKREER